MKRRCNFYGFFYPLSLYLAVLLPGFLISHPSSGQTFHCIIVADTKISDIGPSCTRDLAAMAGRLDTIARTLGYRFNLVVRNDEQFGPQGLNDALDQINCQPSDVVFFYYSGHGFNKPEDTGEFPYLRLVHPAATVRGDSLIREIVTLNTIRIEDVHRRLIEKKPRLCVTLSDCCNQILNDARGVQTLRPTFRGIYTEKDLDMLRRLFSNTEGDVLITTAKRGERALSTSSFGGLYTFSWLDAVQQAEANNNDVTWETLLNDAEQRLQNMLRQNFPGYKKHHSHWRINLKPREVPPPPCSRVTFDQINTFLNQLTDETKSFTERNTLRQQTAPRYFAADGDVKIYIRNPERPVDILPIESYLKNLQLHAASIVRVNVVERLSELATDCRYRILTIEEIR
ncbi:hypothetical protein GCM10023187_52990 [Nibrella viscosa]|uniref:Peptidase C14 caspase domain-containing protein n=1 Tax=Nibrella viscosa TaxID=1084524 RepID=A0ABP8KYT1_9BACT